MENKTLTKAEEQVMHYLWDLKKAFLKDLLDQFPEPKPHSNTISTLLKILCDKDFVDYTVHGRQHEYYPKISKAMYSKRSLKGLIKNYFDGSYRDAVSFLVEKNELSVEDLEVLLQELKTKN